MPTNRPKLSPRPGEAVKLTLLGTRETFESDVVVVSWSEAEVQARTPTGRLLRIPRAQVLDVKQSKPQGEHIGPRQAPADRRPSFKTLANRIDAIGDIVNARVGMQAEALRHAQSELRSVSEFVANPITRKQISRAAAVYGKVAERLAVQSPADAVPLRNLYLSELRDLSQPRTERDAVPIDLRRKIQQVVEKLKQADEQDWQSLVHSIESSPHIETDDLIHVTPTAAGEIEIPIRIKLDGASEIRDVAIRLDQFRGLATIGKPRNLSVLRSDKPRIVRVRMRDQRKQGARGEVRLEAHIMFTDLLGNRRETARQTLKIKIRESGPHRPVENPFRAYASGIPVENPQMFFGRENLIEDITKDLLSARSGVCYTI